MASKGAAFPAAREDSIPPVPLDHIIGRLAEFGYSKQNPAPWNVVIKFSGVGKVKANQLFSMGLVLPATTRESTTLCTPASVIANCGHVVGNASRSISGNSGADKKHFFRQMGAEYPEDAKIRSMVRTITALRKQLRSKQHRTGSASGVSMAGILAPLAADMAAFVRGEDLA